MHQVLSREANVGHFTTARKAMDREVERWQVAWTLRWPTLIGTGRVANNRDTPHSTKKGGGTVHVFWPSTDTRPVDPTCKVINGRFLSLLT